MRKLLLSTGLTVGLFVFASATTETKNEKTNTNKETASAETECTLTVECANGTVVKATGKDCATAGKMIDAGCGG